MNFAVEIRGEKCPDTLRALLDIGNESKGLRGRVSNLLLSVTLMSDSKLVYSTDPVLNVRCPKCKELKSACTCLEEPIIKSRNFVAKLRIEKQGRGGKIVTVIDGLPKINFFLKDLTKQLKNACGSGGTFSMDGKDGVIEIQGDKRERIRSLLEKREIKVKG